MHVRHFCICLFYHLASFIFPQGECVLSALCHHINVSWVKLNSNCHTHFFSRQQKKLDLFLGVEPLGRFFMPWVPKRSFPARCVVLSTDRNVGRSFTPDTNTPTTTLWIAITFQKALVRSTFLWLWFWVKSLENHLMNCLLICYRVRHSHRTLEIPISLSWTQC